MNKMVLIIVGVVVVIGAVVGLGVAGIVPIPGLTHAKKKPKAADAAAEAQAQKDADAKAAADKAQKDAATLKSTIDQRDAMVKSEKWSDALPLSQQIVDQLTKEKPNSAELTAATKVLDHIKDEVDKVNAPKPDPDKGYTKIAAVWSEIEPEKIQEILEADYKPDAAAPILKKMDEDKVAAVFAKMPPKEAATYSAALAKESSKPVPPPPAS